MAIPNPPIKDSWRKWLYTPFILLYLALGAYFTSTGVAWGLDAWLSLGFLLFIIAVNRWLLIGVTGYLLLNAALLTHNLGAFGLYAMQLGIFGYDNIQHLLSSLVAAYIIFNFVARKLHVHSHETKQHTVIDDHTVVLVFLVLASVAFLGVAIELLEFGGYVFLGEGEGILFAGSGDSDTLYGSDGNYVDTMTDIIFNTLGAILGTMLYYFTTYRQRPWMHQHST